MSNIYYVFTATNINVYFVLREPYIQVDVNVQSVTSARETWHENPV